MKAVAIIVAGGRSVRFGGETPKQFAKVAGRPLLCWTIDKFEMASSIESICVVTPADLTEHAKSLLKQERFRKVDQVTFGGETRSQSVLAGLRMCKRTSDLVAIHDAARPLVSPSDIDRVVAAAAAGEAAILAVPASDAIKQTSGGVIRTTIDRAGLYYAQTPQVFAIDVIRRAHEQSGERSFADDAALVEETGVRVQIVEPTAPNIKVTRPEDMALIEGILMKERHG